MTKAKEIFSLQRCKGRTECSVPYIKWHSISSDLCTESGEELGCKDFVAKWHLFCQKLGNHMNKDNEGAALKLLITTIITRNNPSCV